ncbi:uncharacterized protein MYCFIDRAFT_180158 [Pseudocercospora fijiensis CIRAD86]|uniref:Uncharacterized protein n=1 Tax=Pseudocercospora fijiensis (strain CIRAD86) TaxID=383855 RepID=M2ZYG2_PSEFD|nr:uncharacterized protein MYCFIDRAFT_180158 [Pseudocercospora fijiensis CIRAD86]EME77151.1 hypothetical protein MYCFIDRAFT_180158 [Pseudocercospora fijiensis CIRAD86]
MTAASWKIGIPMRWAVAAPDTILVLSAASTAKTRYAAEWGGTQASIWDTTKKHKPETEIICYHLMDTACFEAASLHCPFSWKDGIAAGSLCLEDTVSSAADAAHLFGPRPQDTLSKIMLAACILENDAGKVVPEVLNDARKLLPVVQVLIAIQAHARRIPENDAGKVVPEALVLYGLQAYGSRIDENDADKRVPEVLVSAAQLRPPRPATPTYAHLRPPRPATPTTPTTPTTLIPATCWRMTLAKVGRGLGEVWPPSSCVSEALALTAFRAHAGRMLRNDAGKGMLERLMNSTNILLTTWLHMMREETSRHAHCGDRASLITYTSCLSLRYSFNLPCFPMEFCARPSHSLPVLLIPSMLIIPQRCAHLLSPNWQDLLHAIDISRLVFAPRSWPGSVVDIQLVSWRLSSEVEGMLVGIASARLSSEVEGMLVEGMLVGIASRSVAFFATDTPAQRLRMSNILGLTAHNMPMLMVRLFGRLPGYAIGARVYSQRVTSRPLQSVYQINIYTATSPWSRCADVRLGGNASAQVCMCMCMIGSMKYASITKSTIPAMNLAPQSPHWP